MESFTPRLTYRYLLPGARERALMATTKRRSKHHLFCPVTALALLNRANRLQPSYAV
jgi:hypothetical protein